MLALAALIIAWVRFGTDDHALSDRIRTGQWYGVGSLSVVAIGTLLEHPLKEIFIVEYDRLSVAHVTVAALILCYWGVIGWFARRKTLR